MTATYLFDGRHSYLPKYMCLYNPRRNTLRAKTVRRGFSTFVLRSICIENNKSVFNESAHYFSTYIDSRLFGGKHTKGKYKYNNTTLQSTKQKHKSITFQPFPLKVRVRDHHGIRYCIIDIIPQQQTTSSQEGQSTGRSHATCGQSNTTVESPSTH